MQGEFLHLKALEAALNVAQAELAELTRLVGAKRRAAAWTYEWPGPNEPKASACWPGCGCPGVPGELEG